MPNIKKIGGKIFGVTFSRTEQAAIEQAVEDEAREKLAEFDRRNAREIDALILYSLRRQLGFGVRRLRRFYDGFSRELNALIRRYEMEQGDGVWLCTRMLRDELGIDLEQWEREADEAEGGSP